jgi:hypothetical protein
MDLESLLPLLPLIILGGVTAFLFIIVLIQNVFMGPEGRFHLGRGISGKGIDLLCWDPMSKGVKSSAIRWDGKYWRNSGKKKEGIWLRLQTLVNPISDAEKQFNDAINSSNHWAGCRRPVLLADEELCITLNFETAGMVTKSKERRLFSDPEVERVKRELQDAIDSEEPNGRVDELTKQLHEARKKAQKTEAPKLNDDEIVARLKDMRDVGIETLHIVQPINPGDIETFIQGASPMEMEDTYESGKSEGILLMTQPKPVGAGFGKWLGVIILVAIVIVAGLGIMWLIQSGTLQKLMPKAVMWLVNRLG